MSRSVRFFALCLVASLAGFGCDRGPVIEELPPSPNPGKEDGVGRAGLPVEGSYGDTEAWKVTNQWEERDTPAARQAGMAWKENSGLNWDEKFAAWVGSLERTKSSMGYGDTISISTPFRKSLEGPRIDCADLAIMLRASFAAWYGLPFYLVAGSNPVVYFGHFGVRTANGRWESAPAFAQYTDYSKLEPAKYQAAWPKDAGLRKLRIADDENKFLGAGEGMGAYLDEMHLNKRAARFIWFIETYLGSANLADSNNTYNLVPEALRTGDTLLFRRGLRGSGHTMVVVRTGVHSNGMRAAEDVYGNIPPSQPFFESQQATKGNFTNDEGGGPSANSDGEVYAKIGGGLKRWRVAKAKNGRWMNTWMSADEASWIDSEDQARIAARPAQFDKILGDAPFEERRAGLLEQIEQKRAHLRSYPASCAARERREQLFGELSQLMYDHDKWSPEQTDAAYRSVEDYIFAALDYNRSKTCCWNSTTPQMAQIILSYNAEQQKDQCVAPTPFRRVDGAYAVFAAHAAKLGRSNEWLSWRADEACAAESDTDELYYLKPDVEWCEIPTVPAPTPPGTPVEGADAGTADDGGVEPRSEPVDAGIAP